MRYEDKKNTVEEKIVEEKTVEEKTEQERSAKNETSVSAAEQTEKVFENMEYTGDEVVDQFQKTVFNAGGRVLNLLSEDELLQKIDQDSRKKAQQALEQLGVFRYNIGFAGPQSCGKSSLINAIIGYPLMPTCNLATTCTPVELIYSEEIRVTVKDEDQDGKIVFDKKCGNISKEDFNKLKNYACKVMKIAIIENLQLFSDVYIADEGNLDPDQIKMDWQDARQAALLMLVLFTVYAHQNNKELNSNELELNQLREKTLSYFGITKDTVNYRVIVQWNHPLLASGLMITDLPGLGSSAEDKEADNKTIKGHDTITNEAVLRTDTMAFMSEPNVLADAVPALKAMVSNAFLRDSVSAEDRIVAIMNKVDLLKGAQKKATTIDMMLGMMQNAGVDMTGRKVWETSSYYGEHAYEGMDLSKSFFVQNGIYDLKKDDCDEEEIQEEIRSLLKKLERGYQKSGVNELRDFFRTAFIGRGKYQKIFSSIIALRDLALNAMVPIQTLIETDSALAGVSRDMAKTVLEYLQDAATTPLNEAQKETEREVNKMIEEEYIIDAMLNDAASKYVTAFDVSVDGYSSRLMDISQKFELTFIGFGNRARVDSGNTHNHELYEELLDESGRLKVDLTEVNKSYSRTLQHCSNDIEEIYQHAQRRLTEFKKQYPYILRNCIDSYRKTADPQVITLMDNMVPILLGFVDAKINIADASILYQKTVFQEVSDQLACDIVKMNEEFTAVLLQLVKGKLDTVSGGWFTKKEFLIVDGNDGIKAAIGNLKLNEADKSDLKDKSKSIGLEQIKMPLLGWYKLAETDVKGIMASLSLDIGRQFKKMNENLLDDAANKDNNIERNKELLAKLEGIFDELRQRIQPQIDNVLDLGIGAENTNFQNLKGDLFEGKLTLEA